MSILRVTLGCVLTLVTVSAHAQEPVTGSGSSSTTGSSLSLEERIDVLTLAARGFTSTQIDIPAQKALDYASDIRHLRSRLAEHRTQCQEDIRRSNRDTKMKIVLRCQRGSLMQELTILRKQRAFTAALPGVSDEVKSPYLVASDALQDAILTIVDAIDAELYVAIEDVQETKSKLREQYRVPLWVASLLVRSDEEHLRLGIMAKHLKTLLPLAEGEKDRSVLEGALSCLEGEEALLASARGQISYDNLKVIFGQYQSGRQECTKRLRDVSRLLRSPEATPAQGS